MQEKKQKICIYQKKNVLLQPFLDKIMSSIVDNRTLHAMYRRWIYMAVAIIASLLLFQRPVFNFQDDKGIIYVRSFSMDQKTFYVTQTDIKTGQQEITETMSVALLYYCNQAMLWGCILCLLCFFSDQGRMIIAIITALIAGAYYVLMGYYAIRMSDLHYATLYPHLISALPALVIEMMILVRHNIVRSLVYLDDTSGMQD